MVKTKIKYLLSILLILANLACANIALSADPVVENSNADRFLYEIEVLKNLGIAEDNFDESFKNKSNVSRAEFIALICRLLNFDDLQITGNEKYFSDVDKKHRAYNEITYCVKLGLVAGYPDGRFMPDEDVTPAQAVRIIVAALGYDFQAKEKGGYPMGYLSLASELGLLKGINISSDSMTREEVAKLMYNSLNVDICKIIVAGERAEINIQKGKSVLSEYHGIFKSEGIVSRNSNTTLLTQKLNNIPFVVIDEVNYRPGETDAELYIGRYVTIYFKEEQNEYTILHIDDEKSRGNNLLVKAEDISESTNANRFVYYNESGKTAEITLDGIKVIYNDTACFEYTDSMLKPKTGSVELIDNSFDGIYDVAIVNSYDEYFVSACFPNEKIIYDKYARSPLDLNDVKKLEIVNQSGEEIDINKISLNDILTVKQNHEKEVVSIIRSVKKVSGLVNEYGESDKRIVLSNAEYKLSENFYEKIISGEVKINVTHNATFCLNTFGEIAGVLTSGSSMQYGCILDYSQNRGIADNVSVKMVNDRGEINIYQCDIKISLDGANNVTQNELFDFFKANIIENPLPVRYSLNSHNKINKIDTVYRGINETESLSLFTDYQVVTEAHGKKIIAGNGKDCFYNDKTKIFFVPRKINDNYDEKKIKMLQNVGYKVYIESYNIDDFGVSEAIYVYFTSVSEEFSTEDKKNLPICLIGSITNALDDEGNIVFLVKGLYEGKQINYTLSENLVGTVKPGDVIQLKADENEIVGINPLFRVADKPEMFNTLDCIDTAGVSYFQTTFCRLYEKTNSFLKVSIKENPLQGVMTDYIVFPYQDNVKVYIYHESEGKSKYMLGKLSDVQPGSVIFMRSRGALVNEIIVYDI